MAADKPTLGICLGAQLIAHALVLKYMQVSKEIGWGTLSLSLRPNQVLSPLLNNVHVLHWHGDTFDLPENAVLLASSEIYTNQAFEVGNNILALQFHIETTEENFEKWLIGIHVNFAMPEFQFQNCVSKILNMPLHLSKLHLKSFKNS